MVQDRVKEIRDGWFRGPWTSESKMNVDAFRFRSLLRILPYSVGPQMICQACSQQLSDNSRFCTRCGRPVAPLHRPAAEPKAGDMNLPILYAMVAGLIAALFFPPWETAPGQPPEFLGFHFILSPPESHRGGPQEAGVISRLLLTIELVTIAVAGMYFAWLFRRK